MTPEEAKEILEADKKEREQKAAEAIDAIKKQYNVNLDAILTVGNYNFIANDVLKTPISIRVTAL